MNTQKSSMAASNFKRPVRYQGAISNRLSISFFQYFSRLSPCEVVVFLSSCFVWPNLLYVRFDVVFSSDQCKFHFQMSFNQNNVKCISALFSLSPYITDNSILDSKYPIGSIKIKVIPIVVSHIYNCWWYSYWINWLTWNTSSNVRELFNMIPFAW